MKQTGLFTKFLLRLTVMLELAIFCIVLASCENFLKGGDIRKEIEETIKYNNALSSTLVFRVTNNIGDFLTGDTKSCKLGYTIDIQYQVISKDYLYQGMEAVSSLNNSQSRADYVEFTDIGTESEKNNGLYRIRIKLLKQAEDIMIRPKNLLLPGVKQILPAYVKAGCEQDSTITIEFNKTVAPSSFGNFSCISIKNEEEELFYINPDLSYFGTPYFTSENTILNIPTVKGKYIIPEGQNQKDIIVTIDTSLLKDADGLSLKAIEPHTYRINQNKDNIKPEVKAVTASNEEDSNLWYYKTLTDKADLTQWSDAIEYESDGTTIKYLNGDYSRNHIIDNVYFILQGYDKDSGIKNVRVTQVYEKTEGGAETSKMQEQKDFGVGAFIPVDDQTDYYYYSFNYKFSSKASDGLYRLDLSVVDNADNVSEPVSYYVIKDSSLRRVVKWDGYLDVPYAADGSFGDDRDIITQECLPVYNSETGKYESKLIFKTFNIFKDIFYASYKTHCTSFMIQMYDQNNEPVTIFEKEKICDSYMSEQTATFQIISEKQIKDELNAVLSNIVIDPDVTTRFRVVVLEENGIQNEYTFSAPKRPRIATHYFFGNSFEIRESDNNYFIDSDTSIFLYDETGVARKKKGENEFSSYRKISTTAEDLFDEDDTTYYLSFTRKVRKSEGNIYSAFSEPYILYRKDNESTFVDGHYGECIHIPSQVENFDFPDFSFPKQNSSSVEYPKNTGKVRFSVKLTWSQDANSTQKEYEYLIKVAKDSDYEDVVGVYSSRNLELENHKAYKISLLACNSDGIVVAESEAKQICYEGPDNFPPHVSLPVSATISDVNRNWILVKLYDYDGEIESGTTYYSEKHNRIKSVDCYYSSVFLGTEVTLEQLKQGNYPVYNILLPENKDIDSLKIPLYCLEPGKVYLYCYVQDIAGNGAIYSSSAQNFYGSYVLPFVPEYNITNNVTDASYKTLFNIEFPLYTDELKPDAEDAYDKDDGWNGYDFATRILSKFDIDTKDWLNISTDQRATNQTADGNWSHDDEKWTVNWRVTNNDSYIAPNENCFYKVDVIYGVSFQCLSVWLCPLYFYKGSDDYDYNCNNKSVMDSYNGYQVFCEKPAFGHTLYSKFKLTETCTLEDSHIWEGRGAETGIVYSDGSAGTFSYTTENFAGIPDDCYYTTIFHFADGSTVMTPVKQKK